MKDQIEKLAAECDAKAAWIIEGGVARSETADLLFRVAIALRGAKGENMPAAPPRSLGGTVG